MNLHQRNYKWSGKAPEEASKALVLIHGRGGNAQQILRLSEELFVKDFAVVAPQAYNNSWYPLSFLAPEQQNQPWLDDSIDLLSSLEQELNGYGISSENIFFLGFSQGACLCLEYTTRKAKRYGGVAAVIGGLIGDQINTGSYVQDFEQTKIFLASVDPDSHVPIHRVLQTAEILKNKNARVKLDIIPNGSHTISPEHLGMINSYIFDYTKEDH